jgi:hypothetical protein
MLDADTNWGLRDALAFRDRRLRIRVYAEVGVSRFAQATQSDGMGVPRRLSVSTVERCPRSSGRSRPDSMFALRQRDSELVEEIGDAFVRSRWIAKLRCRADRTASDKVCFRAAKRDP